MFLVLFFKVYKFYVGVYFDNLSFSAAAAKHPCRFQCPLTFIHSGVILPFTCNTI